MYITFDELLEQLGRSVQEAQARLERQALETFLSSFEGSEHGVGDTRRPRMLLMSLPNALSGDKPLEVPEAALMRHDAMSLDTVHIKLNLRTQTRSEDNVLLVEPGPAGELDGESENYGQVELTFRASPPSEGIARIDCDLYKNI